MKTLDLVIIGSGPGGYVAAIRASQLGRKVTVIEKDVIGGTCLNVGCVPSKALLHIGHKFHDVTANNDIGIVASEPTLDFEKAMKWKDARVVKKLRMGVTQLLKKNKVEILTGEATFTSHNTLEISSGSSKETYTFKDCVVAPGSKPIELKALPLSERIVDSTGVLSLKQLPKTMTVIGAGYIGSELAQAYAMLGTKITMVEAGPTILPGFDLKISKEVKKSFDELSMDVKLDSMVIASKEESDHVVLEVKHKEETFEIKSDVVLVSVGRVANSKALNLDKANVTYNDKGLIVVDKQCRTSNANIYAIGDAVAGLQLAHKASYEAKVVAEVLAGKHVEVDYKAIPAVCYTTPEIATTGLTKDEAQEKGMKVSEHEFPLMANSRAIASNDTQGFVCLVVEEKSNLVVGAQIVGQNASEIITIITLAIETGLTSEDIALTIFPHPSVSEAIMDDAELAMGYPIHL